MVSVARPSSASLSTRIRASMQGRARAGPFAAIAAVVATVTLALVATAPAVAGAKKTAVLKPWAGRWNGPEGLFLEIAPASKPGTVRIVLKDTLDDQATYTGTLDGDVIRFVRNGTAEAIRHGTGAETGFKWLAGKKNCLIVIEDKEGYCR